MATDVYVMPLWKFKAGEFGSPLETLGVRTLVVTQDGLREEKPRRPGIIMRWRCRRSARRLMRDVSRAAGTDVRWTDDGTVVYSNQFRGGTTIRAFLWWFDRRDCLPGYPEAIDGNDVPKVADPAPERGPSRPHLSMNGYYSDYFIPVDFPDPVRVEPFLIAGRFPATRVASSTMRALAELEPLLDELEVPRGFRFDWDGTSAPADPLLSPKLALSHLREVLEKSRDHGLPVIFYG